MGLLENNVIYIYKRQHKPFTKLRISHCKKKTLSHSYVKLTAKRNKEQSTCHPHPEDYSL